MVEYTCYILRNLMGRLLTALHAFLQLPSMTSISLNPCRTEGQDGDKGWSSCVLAPLYRRRWPYGGKFHHMYPKLHLPSFHHCHCPWVRVAIYLFAKLGAPSLCVGVACTHYTERSRPSKLCKILGWFGTFAGYMVNCKIHRSMTGG